MHSHCARELAGNAFGHTAFQATGWVISVLYKDFLECFPFPKKRREGEGTGVALAIHLHKESNKENNLLTFG